MIVQCPECQTKFRLDEEKITSDQIKLRCSKCTHTFTLQEASGTPTPEAPSREPDDLDLGFDEPDLSEPSPEPEPAAPFPEDEDVEEEPEPAAHEGPEDDESGLESDTGEEGGSGIPDISDLPQEADATVPARSPRKRLWLLLVLLVLAGAVLAGVFYYPQIKSYLPFAQGNGRSSDMEQKLDVDIESVKDIALQDVRQYFVNNEKVGELFVIEGRAVNNFSGLKELIKLEAELFDSDGQVVQSKRFLGGNTASLFQLQVLSREELNGVLQAKVGVLTNNTNLNPGAEVPFMVVFYNPPGTVEEFGLKVVEVKDPPQ